MQQAIMQREVEMQLKGAEAQVKGQSEVMVRFALKDVKKMESKEKKKSRKTMMAAEAGGKKVDTDSGSGSSSL
jgi:hypothetical protein